MHHAMALGTVSRATKLIGTTTVNNQNEKLGKVENLMIDLPSGRIVEVIVASGGFLGIDAEMSAVPPQAFRYDVDEGALTLNTTKAALGAAPHFKNSEWKKVEECSRYSRPACSSNES